MTEQIQITIVGTGCIGTSIGLVLHESKEPPLVVGHDKEPDHAARARKAGAIDKSDWNLIGACEEADLVVLSIPMNGIEDTLRALAPHLKDGCVITDTASLKQQPLEWADDLLPETVNFVGGNPVLTSSGSGPDAASPDLFQGKLYCVTPSSRAHPDAVSLVSSLVAVLGGKPYFVDAAEHDGLMAGAAHLPLAMGLALTNGAASSSGWREMRKLAGAGFDTVTGLIGEDGDALSTTLHANREHLIPWIEAYEEELRRLRAVLGRGEIESLNQLSRDAVKARDQWIEDQRSNFADPSPVADIERPSFLGGLFFGRGFRPKKDK